MEPSRSSSTGPLCMAESVPKSIHAPIKQPNLTRKVPVTGILTGLMAALVTRLAETIRRRAGAT
jgi:hypothetical protein